MRFGVLVALIAVGTVTVLVALVVVFVAVRHMHDNVRAIESRLSGQQDADEALLRRLSGDHGHEPPPAKPKSRHLSLVKPPLLAVAGVATAAVIALVLTATPNNKPSTDVQAGPPLPSDLQSTTAAPTLTPAPGTPARRAAPSRPPDSPGRPPTAGPVIQIPPPEGSTAGPALTAPVPTAVPSTASAPGSPSSSTPSTPSPTATAPAPAPPTGQPAAGRCTVRVSVRPLLVLCLTPS